jgi:hypothetical protein
MNLEILKTYNLIQYAANMHALYVDLKQLKQQFPNGFEPHHRIVFYNQDTDFFLADDLPGFTLFNLQLILKELDISNYFCGHVSNLPNFDKYTRRVRDMLVKYDMPMRAITSLYGTGVNEDLVLADVALNQHSIQHPFICMNRQSRFHRTFMVAKLFEKNLQHQGLVSYHNIPGSQEREHDHRVAEPMDPAQPFFYLETRPWSRLNSKIELTDPVNQALVKDFQHQVTAYKNFTDQATINNKVSLLGYQNSIIQQALIYVGTETVAVYPEPCIGSISFKGILDKRPFMILCSPGSLAYMRDLGFRTFGSWWDESYDQEPDFEKRVAQMVNILQEISTCSPAELQTICQQMEPVLQHNFQHFTQHFLKQEKDKVFNGLLDPV